jgi:cytoskeletal protein CcmA (bactofilin family)
VEGTVTAKHQALVAKGGEIIGDIVTREAVIGGTVHGAVNASERVEIQAGAVVDGDITTRRISVAEGSRINGQIRMQPPPAEPRPQAARADVATKPEAPRPQAAPIARPSVPVARVAVPPRPAGH